MTDASRRFAEELNRIERLALGHATSPQAGNTRIDGGILEWGDDDGNVIGRIGPDGEGSLDIEYVYGPKPKRPSTPIVTSDAGFVRVRWDGDWASSDMPDAAADPDVVGTNDTDRVEIHLSLDEFFVPDPVVSFAGTFSAVDGGGDSTVGPLTEAGTYWCVLLTRSKTGQYSEPSDRVPVEVSTVNLESELFGLALKADEAMESADGKNSVYYGDEEPKPKPVTDEDGNPVLDEDGNPIYTEFRDGDIWFGEGNLPHIWSEESGEWVSARDSRLDELQDAIDNIEVDFDTDTVLAEARDEAQRLADQARDAAIAADATTFWLPEEVAGYEPQHWGEYAPQDPKEGDLALVPNLPGLGGGFISYRYRSGAWVEASDAIAKAAMEFTGVALSTADEAQQTANGKNKITRSLDNPPVVYTGAVNDLWWRLSSMGSGGRVISQWRWNGSVWVSELVGDETIANVNAAKITAGYLDAARIQAQSISVDKLIVSSNANLISDPQFASAGAGWSGQLDGPVPPQTEFTDVQDGPGGVFAPVARITVPSNDFTAFYSKSWPQWPESGSDPLQGMRGTEVRPGESYRFVLRARVVQRPTTGVGGLRLRGGFSLNGGSRQWPLLTDNLLTDAPLGEWRDVTGVWAHDRPNEARNRLSVGIHAASSAGAIFEVAFVGMYAMTTSELIVDGAVTARTVSAGAIGATAIAAEAIEGRHVKAGSLLADAVLVPGSVGGTLIADGAVTTNHLKAGSITAESGIIGSLDAGVITTGELRGELIRAGSIAGRALAADAIDGKTITGATIRTAAAGARVEMNNQGLTQYNAFGSPIVTMKAGEFTVTGGTITGSTVRTSATGARVELNKTGIHAYDPDGAETLNVSANTGTVNLVGNLSQNNTWGLLRVGPEVFQAGGAGEAAPGIAMRRHSAPASPWGPAGISLRDTGLQSGSLLQVQSEFTPAQGGSWLDIASSDSGAWTQFVRSQSDEDDDRSWVGLPPSGAVYVTSNGAEAILRATPKASDDAKAWARVNPDGSAYLASDTGGQHYVYSTGAAGMDNGDGGYMQVASNSNLFIQANSSGSRQGAIYIRRGSNGADGGHGYMAVTADGIYISPEGNRFTRISGDNVQIPTLPSSTSAVPIGRVSGRLHAIASARKYKLLEEPISETIESFSDKLLSVEAKTWIDRGEAERLAEYKTAKYKGEDPDEWLSGCRPLKRVPGVVAEDLVDAGLEEFVQRGDDGEVESVMYDRIGPALIPIVREQRDRITQLEEELETIKEMLNV